MELPLSARTDYGYNNSFVYKKHAFAAMKIFLPIQVRSTGGTSTFAKKLKKALESNGDTVTFSDSLDYDILLVLVSCPMKYLLYAKIHKKPIVHRLDGAYYPSTVAGRLYYLYNLPAKIIHRFFSDHTIYQSNYSKYSCDIFLGKRTDGKWNIVYNGVDTTCFSPAAKPAFSNKQIFVTASRFRKEDQIMPIIHALELYAKKYTANFYCNIIGDFTGSVAHIPEKYKNVPHLRFRGVVANANLPHYLQSSHIFLFTHQNPPCPNNIIEAMACGLPICGVADGAMGEIAKEGENSELIASEGDAFYNQRQLDLLGFADNIHKIMNNQALYSAHSRKIAEERFRVETMVEQYSSIFNALALLK